MSCKTTLSASLLVLLLASSAAPAALPDFTDLVVGVGPAVVNISTTQTLAEVGESEPELPVLPDLPEGHPFDDLFRRFFGEQGPRDVPSSSLGSGFIISDDGYILSNHHVVEGADEVLVRLNDRRVLTANVIGSDRASDIALLKVDASNLPTVKIGDSGRLQVGEWVLAIGSPFGFEHTVTAGIVSGKGRSLPSESYVPFIQTDVAINPGNSGGPLFNMRGQVVGVNSQIYSRTGGFMGLSFAVPIEMAINVAEQIKDKGRVSRGWLGVLIQEVTRELAESFGMESPRGALVAKVFDQSPAAGELQVGDVVMEFDGEPVESSASLPPLVGSTVVGADVPVKVLRDGRAIELRIIIGELPEERQILSQAPAPESLAEKRLGLDVTDLAAEVREQFGVDHGAGVLAVEPGSAAAAAGLRKGDVILMLNGEKVEDAVGFRSLIENLPADRSVPILVQRENGPVFLALKAAGD
jgi:serine protease Do